LIELNSYKLIFKYFNKIDNNQKEKIIYLKELYEYWNQKVNLISRKDMNNFYLRHVLHSLSIKKISLINSSKFKIMDVGTGGGFPGIPLAILYPKNIFYLLDSKSKKIRIIKEIAKELNIENITTINKRIEEEYKLVNFVVCRGLSSLQKIYSWTNKNIIKSNNNGLICLKGGDLKKELESLRKSYFIYELNKYFSEDFFETKKIIYIPINNSI
tara:strand:+ start:172 stop:813 length:642 start_codon:yes stop_codon:yes gene_type:complete